MHLNGIHHISCITGDAAGNVAFYTGVVGLRLIAKTVNQDDPSVYHLFYGDEEAHPGLDLTFFEYRGARPGRPGAGNVHRIVWRVADADAIAFWESRLRERDVRTDRLSESLVFWDPEGLEHELIIDTTQDAPLIADHPEIPAHHAIRGFEGVRAYVGDPRSSVALVEHLMHATERPDGAWEIRGSNRGGWIAFDAPPPEPGINGAGVVHHVAWSLGDDTAADWVERLRAVRIPNSGIVDRHYFDAVYFREPSGILYELSSIEPGFTVDGPVEELGTKVIFPPWLEPQREALEARLTPLPDPRADWPARD
jgi:glyoxalase family protein